MRVLHRLGVHVGKRPAGCIGCRRGATQRLVVTMARSHVRHRAYTASDDLQRREAKDLIRRARLARGEDPDVTPGPEAWVPLVHQMHGRGQPGCGNCELDARNRNRRPDRAILVTLALYRLARGLRGN